MLTDDGEETELSTSYKTGFLCREGEYSSWKARNMEREIQEEEMLGKDRGQGAETKSIDPHRAGTAIYQGHISDGGSRAFDILSHINYGKHSISIFQTRNLRCKENKPWVQSLVWGLNSQPMRPDLTGYQLSDA